jgi:biotin operon repressor
VNSDKKTIDKIIDIYAIKPFATQVELSEYLNISKMAICKQMKKLKNG